MVEFSRGGVQRLDCVDVAVEREKKGLCQGKVCSEGLNYIRQIRLPRLAEVLLKSYSCLKFLCLKFPHKDRWSVIMAFG